MKRMRITVPLELGENVYRLMPDGTKRRLRVVYGRYELGRGWEFGGEYLDPEKAGVWFLFAEEDLGCTVYREVE